MKPRSEHISIYVHIPFCAARCRYCDFNTYAGMEELHEPLVDALILEARRWSAALAGRQVSTLYIGGGTPTVLRGVSLARVLRSVHELFDLDPDAEITCEANPDSSDLAVFDDLLENGVNRLSLGVQSMADSDLHLLGRVHDADQALRAFNLARLAGFDNVSIDLMFGLAHEGSPRSLSAWRETLQQAIALAPEHLSLYSLIVEPGTPLAAAVASGALVAPDDDRAADEYETAMEVLDGAGYSHYEVSNWARAGGLIREVLEGGQAVPASNATATPALASRHNLAYWRNGEYIGLGPGAHSHLREDAEAADLHSACGSGGARHGSGGQRGDLVERRFANVLAVQEYIERVVDTGAAVDFEEYLTPRQAMGETMMLGLRLVREGVPHARFEALHGCSPLEVFEHELGELRGLSLIDVDAVRTRLTRRGLMLGNRVFRAFVTAGQ